MRARARSQGATSTPEVASSTKLRAGSPLLAMSSWNPGGLTSARRVAARDQLPRGDTRHTRDGTLIAHPGNRVAGKGEVIRRTAHLGEGARPAPGRLSCSDLGRAQNAGPTEPVPLWSAENLNLGGLNLGSAHNPGPTLGSSPAEQPGA